MKNYHGFMCGNNEIDCEMESPYYHPVDVTDIVYPVFAVIFVNLILASGFYYFSV